jgi:hypothetical protein
MKTTVEIQDDLLRSAKRQARRERTTLRALIEEGLRRVLRGRKDSTPFRLRDASVAGKGVQEGIREGDWETIRALIYEGRGG